jgi:hypothetical protein
MHTFPTISRSLVRYTDVHEFPFRFKKSQNPSTLFISVSRFIATTYSDKPSNPSPYIMAETHPKPTHLALVLHSAVDYVLTQSVGIGITQQAQCATTGASRNSIMRTEERKYGIRREHFVAQNVKTRKRATMLSLVHAFGLARSTIKRQPCAKTITVQVRKVTVFSSSQDVVRIVNHHL